MISAAVRQRLAAFVDEPSRHVGLLARKPDAFAQERLSACTARFSAALAACLDDDARGASTTVARGIAIEGQGAAHALLDAVDPQERLPAWSARLGSQELFLAALGAGVIWARFPKRDVALPGALDPLVDGLGFGTVFFAPYRLRRPAALGREDDAFLRGVGRALWYLGAGDVEAMGEHADRFARPGPVWGGMGTAMTFSGGGTREVAIALIERAGRHRRDVERAVEGTSSFAGQAENDAAGIAWLLDLVR